MQFAIQIDATITDLSEEQQDHFGEQIEWWDSDTNALFAGDAAELDEANATAAIRVTFRGHYDEEEDDFAGSTVFTRSISEDERPTTFSKRDKQRCGFLYLRTQRTGSRALSLERGSLLDIILRLKEVRPRMWEDTIQALRETDVAVDPELGLSGILGEREQVSEEVRAQRMGRRSSFARFDFDPRAPSKGHHRFHLDRRR